MNENRVGVWAIDGKVYRRDLEGEKPRLYIPHSIGNISRVKTLVREIKEIGSAEMWTPVVEKALDERLTELRKLAIF